jgi:hypothetical protein
MNLTFCDNEFMYKIDQPPPFVVPINLFHSLFLFGFLLKFISHKQVNMNECKCIISKVFKSISDKYNSYNSLYNSTYNETEIIITDSEYSIKQENIQQENIKQENIQQENIQDLKDHKTKMSDSLISIDLQDSYNVESGESGEYNSDDNWIKVFKN